MDLLLDDDAATQALRDLTRLCAGEGYLSARNGNTMPRENALRLILVDFHEGRRTTDASTGRWERQTSSHDVGDACALHQLPGVTFDKLGG
jgi:hypothetical protein